MSSVKKIAIIGGESTGKSTLCALLALHYGTVWVPEFAREYLSRLNRTYTYDDLLIIAKGQKDSEEKYFPLASRFLFCDTDLNVIKVWSEHKYQKCHPYILQEIQNAKYNAYILTAPDFPWESDALREHPGPEMRKYFFEVYQKIVETSQTPYTTVFGDTEERLTAAISFIDKSLY